MKIYTDQDTVSGVTKDLALKFGQKMLNETVKFGKELINEVLTGK